jgi:hypothetical protein
MPKGFFTQSATVLLERPFDLGALERCLKDFQIVRRAEPSNDPWMGAQGLVIGMRPEVNGHAIVDVVDQPWPDGMGDPNTDPALFGAWSMGFFGPFVFPEGLARARAMSFAWPEGRALSATHRAFVRIKTSYVLGAGDDVKVIPADYDAISELDFVTELVRSVLELPEAIAYFNPNGEVLLSRERLAETLEWADDHDVVPQQAWANVRLFKLDDEWTMMDTVGMEQMDIDDHEACFLTGKYAPGEVDAFLRTAADYVLQEGPVIEDGNTMDGPGNVRWSARSVEDSLAPRPRQVLRWTPLDGSTLPSR